MQKLLNLTSLTAMLLGLPLCGVWLTKAPVSGYLEFPPRTRFVEHAPFSWPIFLFLAALIIAILLFFLIRIFRANLTAEAPSVNTTAQRFPWWGWFALQLGIVFWMLAWTRFEWMAPFQRYTFTPQWLCYILFINALTFRKTGRCLLTDKTCYFLMLFPLSAAFWWFFEYLNRFVQNWWYTCGETFTPLQYFIAATLPFATVLPAVLSTEEALACDKRITAGLENVLSVRMHKPDALAWITLVVSGGGLLFIGRFPDLLFPLLWVAPLLLLIAFRHLEKRPSFFPELKTGDWRRIYRFALSALICGFFWELWNWHSLAKWIYSIPYVDRFHLFEMPILGYAGYLPFGLECAVVAALLDRKNGRSSPQ